MAYQSKKWLIQTISTIIFALIAIILSLYAGELKPSINDLFNLIMGNEGGIELSILRQIRIPRIILALAVGSSLSISGTILQGVYRNPLVEPYTLGISGGAALGVVLAIVFHVDKWMGQILLPLSGFTGAFISLLIVYNISIKRGKIRIQTMLLIGVMFSYIASSVMMLLLSVVTSEEMRNIIFWTMGSLNEPDNNLIKIAVFLSLLGLLVSYLFVQAMNAMRLGHEKAGHLGINTETSIRVLFVIASVLTGMAVSIAGVIGFVGLIIPHVTRLLFGSDNRILLITSFIGGGAFLLICDTIARTIILPNELPTGVITGIIGGIIFMLIITKKK